MLGAPSGQESGLNFFSLDFASLQIVAGSSSVLVEVPPGCYSS